MSKRATRRMPWKTTASIAFAVFAGSAGVAAASYSTTDYFYGAPGVTALNESAVAAKCHIWGLDHTHNLTGCKGNNLIVADGECPPGTVNGDSDQYCQITQNPNDPGDTLRGGGGTNIIIAGGGPQTIYGGTGSNGVYTGPGTNTYYGGNTGDAVYAAQGSGTINLGTGENFVYASSSGVYHIICTGKNDYVYIQKQDTTKNCAHVCVGNGQQARDGATSRRTNHHRRHHERRDSGRDRRDRQHKR